MAKMRIWMPSILGILFAVSNLAAALAGSPASSAFTESNFTVPEYVTRYAPLVWLHSEDQFRPSDLLTHIRHTTPTVKQQPVSGSSKLDLNNLGTLNTLSEEVYLTSNDDPTTLPIWLLGEMPDAAGKINTAIPCVVILIEKGARDVDAFFFYFYSYNQGDNVTGVVEPIRSLLDLDSTKHFGNHVGDWEHNMIRFEDGKPTGVYYSQHSDGEAYAWNDTKLTKQNDRPIVYSAIGSHANYAAPGQHIHDAALMDFCDAGYQWDPVFSAYYYLLDPSDLTLTPLNYTQSSAAFPYPTSFINFTGMWGDRQYEDTDPRQETVKYFHLKRFVSGPTGPLSKQLVRKGLFPDHRHVKSWMEWGVVVYMSWYPCCLRGWRVWVSLAVVLAVLVGIALGIRIGIMKYRKRGYKRLDTEIPLNDLGRYD